MSKQELDWVEAEKRAKTRAWKRRIEEVGFAPPDLSRFKRVVDEAAYEEILDRII